MFRTLPGSIIVELQIAYDINIQVILKLSVNNKTIDTRPVLVIYLAMVLLGLLETQILRW